MIHSVKILFYIYIYIYIYIKYVLTVFKHDEASVPTAYVGGWTSATFPYSWDNGLMPPHEQMLSELVMHTVSCYSA